MRRKDKTETRETEIDILAVSAKSDKFLVGECKFKKHPFSYGEYLDTIAKLSLLKEKAEFSYYLFSESGFDEKIISEALNNDHLKLIDAEYLVNG